MVKKKSKLTLKWMICGALVVLALLITQLYPLLPLSIFSVSQINLKQQGYEDPQTHEWKDSYWVIGLVTDTFEHYEGINYEFNNEEAQSVNKIGEKTLVVNSAIKVTIIPEKPYYERTMEYKTYKVYPKTYATWMNKLDTGLLGKLEGTSINELDATVLRFTTESWKLYTPFKVQLYKNDVLKSEKYVNTLGGTAAIILTGDSSEEDLTVYNLGKIGTGIGEPSFGDVIVFDTAHIFKTEGNILNEIQYDMDDYSYSRYWFGGGSNYYAYAWYGGGPVIRWGDDEKSPAHFWKWGVVNEPMETQMFPGVYRDDVTLDYYMKPVSADIFNDKQKDKPVSGSPFGYSLINYLVNERKHRLYVLDDFNEYRQGIEIKDNKMRIYLPLGSFNNLVTIWVSTELADAIVYQPVPAKGVFTEIKWLSSGSGSSSISDKDIVSAKVSQEGKDGGRITITASGMTGYPISVSPTTDSVILNYGETHTFFFLVKNLGTSSVQSGILRFVLTNDAGTETDSKSLNFELKP